MKPTFVTHSSDQLGVKAIQILQEAGCQTMVIEGDEELPAITVVFFTHPKPPDMTARHGQVATHKIMKTIPQWAKTPFAVALRHNPTGDFTKMARQAALTYERWFATGAIDQPWTMPAVGDTWGATFQGWQAQMQEYLAAHMNGQTWEITPALLPKTHEAKAHGKGYRLNLNTQAQEANVGDLPKAEQLEKEVAFVALLGAFNLEVGRSMPSEQLHLTFLQLRKRLALVAEAALPGAGSLIYRLYNRLSESELMQREVVMPLFEAILVFGRNYDQLSTSEMSVADQFQIADEQSHFSRIMDVDALREFKRQVGVADAGNPLIARMLMNAARYREDLGLNVYWPIPYVSTPEAAKAISVGTYAQVRKSYPYTACVISADTDTLALDMVEIYRRLITQYPLEIVFLMIEEWLMSMGIEDSEVSMTAVQIIRSGEYFQVKMLNVGGGTVVVKGDLTQVHDFNPSGNEYELGRLSVGKLDFQQTHHLKVIPIEAGDEVYVFPYHEGGFDRSLVPTTNLANTTGIKVNVRKHVALLSFQWTESHVQQELAAVVDAIAALHPERVDVQFGHVHGDRDPGEDQKIGAFIAGVFARMVQACGLHLESRPMSDNYHVVDRLNFPDWVALLQQHSGLPITEVTFEDALISRHLGDEIIARLYATRPQDIIFQGGNYYFRPPELGDMMIELYDGVPTPDVTGRMGCVPFQIGFELYRLNPNYMNAAYWTWLVRNYPESLPVQWHREDVMATYQELMLKHVYLLPAEQRMALKAQVDSQIDRPYDEKCMRGATSLLHGLLEASDMSQVVLIHVLEGFYDAQERKSSTLWQALGLPRVNQWRISFNRANGKLQALDWNRHIK